VILGVGLDVVRIGGWLDEVRRRGAPSADAVLGPRELEYCNAQADPAPSGAARVAAKAALFKALDAARQRWLEVEVVRDARGQPSLELSGETAAAARRLGVERIHLSLTHSSDHAAAIVVIET